MPKTTTNKRGRPRLPESEKLESVKVGLTSEQVDFLDRLSDERGYQSFAAAVRWCVEESRRRERRRRRRR